MNSDTTPVAPAAQTRITLVSNDRPWVWLEAGWRDLMAMPHIGFFYGGAVVLAGWVLVVLLLQVGVAWAVLPATAGFFLVASATGCATRFNEIGELSDAHA
jgi:uncharacterized membrane protein